MAFFLSCNNSEKTGEKSSDSNENAIKIDTGITENDNAATNNNVLKFNIGNDCTTVNMPQTTDLLIFKHMDSMVCKLYL